MLFLITNHSNSSFQNYLLDKVIFLSVSKAFDAIFQSSVCPWRHCLLMAWMVYCPLGKKTGGCLGVEWSEIYISASPWGSVLGTALSIYYLFQ